MAWYSVILLSKGTQETVKQDASIEYMRLKEVGYKRFA
jgi:hypothetical protein